MNTEHIEALVALRKLEKAFIYDATTSPINTKAWWKMFGQIVDGFHLHDLAPISYVPFLIWNYVATGGLEEHLPALVNEAGVHPVPLPFTTRMAIQVQQVVIGADVLHALVMRGIEHWPRDIRPEALARIATGTKVADLGFDYERHASTLENQAYAMNGRRDVLRRFLQYADGTMIITAHVAPDVTVSAN